MRNKRSDGRKSRGECLVEIVRKVLAREAKDRGFFAYPPICIQGWIWCVSEVLLAYHA